MSLISDILPAMLTEFQVMPICKQRDIWCLWGYFHICISKTEKYFWRWR